MDFSRIFADLTPIALTLYRSKAFSADPWRIMPELSRNWAVDTLYNRKEKNNPKKIIFYPKGVDNSQNKNYNKNTETQKPNYNSFMEVFKMKIYELRPVDNRKSFYGKAKIIEKDNGEKVLQSYNTEVCKITSGGEFVRLWDNYSATTMRHVNAFLSLFGIAGGGKAWWDAQTISA